MANLRQAGRMRGAASLGRLPAAAARTGMPAHPRRPSLCTGAPGFSLLEILVAMALTALVLLGAARLSARSIDLQEEAGFAVFAAMLAEQRAACIAGEATLVEGKNTGNFGDVYSAYRFAEEIHRDPVAAGLYTVRIRILAADRRDRRWTVETMIFRSDCVR